MSAMRSSAEILEQAARDGSIDISEWPRVLENVLQKLHDVRICAKQLLNAWSGMIVHNDFPLPHTARPAPAPAPTLALAAPTSGDDSTLIAASSPPAPESSDPLPTLTHAAATSDPQDSLSQSSVTTNKENAPPPRPPVPSFNVNNTPNVPPTSTLQQSDPIPDSPLPPDLLNSYQSSTNILRNAFATAPPYTIQRLAELVLNPRRNYRFLPSFLSALDRAVSVTSPVTDFPLPQFHRFSDSSSLSFLTNASEITNGIAERGALGSDESLGGALLTPIPWLRKRQEDQSTTANTTPGSPAGVNRNQELRTETEETIDGPHGAGRIETVSVTTNRLGLPLTTTTTTTNESSPNLSLSPSPSSSDPSERAIRSSPTGDGEGQEAALAQDLALRSAGGVTQGELLRQEQEKGVVPLGLEVPRHPLLNGQPAGPATPLNQDPESDEHPHARGPNVIGMEDTGPQAHGVGRVILDMEAAAGRKSPGGAPSSPSFDALQPASVANVKTEEQGDPVLPEGNVGGAAETANVTAAAVGKRKRDEADEEAKEEANKVKHGDTEQHETKQEAENEDEEMIDA